MERAAIYVRVSTEEQAREGYSIDAQINTLTLYAELYGYKVVKIYKDEGLSGKNVQRPALKQMLKDVQDKIFDILLIWKISRLSRNLTSLLNIVDLLDSHGISFISQSETFNTLTPVGRMTLQILGSIAEFERNTIIENVRLGLREKAKRGEWLGGRVLGYKSVNKKLEICQEEMEIVKSIFNTFDQNNSICKTTKIINKFGYKTLNNKEFCVSSIKRILSNPIYKGELRHKEIGTVEGLHQPIIDIDLFNRTQEKLLKIIIKNVETQEFLLTGLLKCPICRGNLVRYKTGSYRYYRCGKYHNYGKDHCKGSVINAQNIEKIIVKKVQDILKTSSICKNLYDILGFEEIFQDDFIEKFELLEFYKKKEIIKCLIDKIELRRDKTIKKVVLKAEIDALMLPPSAG